MLELILAVVFASVASAFCSVSEAAFYSFPWSRIEQLRKQGRKSGEILHAMRSDVEKPIAAVLTLNTVANTAGAAVAGAAWVHVYGAESLAWFTAAFTALILLVGEIIPKTAGVAYNRTLMPWLARPLQWLIWALSPLVWVVGLFGRMVRRGKKGPEATEEDIRALVSLTRRAGVLKPYEDMAIRNILSLDSKSVDQIMTPRTVVFSLPGDMTVAEARDSHATWPHSRIPVYEGEDPEDVVGIIFRRQVFEALADDRDDIRLSDLMRPVDFVLESITLDKLLVRFLESRQHLFVVLDEYGGMAGVVTLEDVLEEILGSEIVDETDQVVDMRELARRRRSQLTKTAASGSRAR
jgi:CBS domain containing-hemolysin-like protein